MTSKPRGSSPTLRVVIITILLGALSACGSHGPASTQPQAAASTNVIGDLLTDVKQRGKIVISTDADYQPLSFRTSNGTWRGFDIDVGREIARRLSVKAAFVDIPFDAIIGGNWNGRWDLNVNSMTVTRDRQRVLYFTDPYYYEPAVFIVHKSSRMKSIEDLNGKRVGVGAATTYQAYLEGHLTLTREKILIPAPDARAVPYNTDQLALQDLAAGEGVHLDAVLTSLPFVEDQIKKGAPYRVLTSPVFYEDSAIAVDKSSPKDPEKFYQAVEKAVRDMHNDGTLSRLSKQYYGIDLTTHH